MDILGSHYWQSSISLAISISYSERLFPLPLGRGISDSTLRVFGGRFDFCWMAVLASPEGISFSHSTFYDFFVLSLLTSSRSATLIMATFPSTVNGYRASCLFDPQSPVSTVSSFSL
jgi:hypothetical protein